MSTIEKNSTLPSKASKPPRKRKIAKVTRITIETQNGDKGEVARPRLKSGIHISRPEPEAEKSLIVAMAHRAISIQHPGARAIIAKFDGTHGAVEISDEIDAPIEVVETVIAELLDAQLLDLTKSKIRLHNRFQSTIAERAAHNQDQSNDAFFRQLQSRMAPELTQTTWIDDVVDGGVEKLSDRQSFGVEIYGGNRVATMIYCGLLASGVTNTKFSITSRREGAAIADADLGTGILRSNDFGVNYKARLEELSREWSLFPTASKNVKGLNTAPIPERNLRVVVGNYQPEIIEQFMRDGMDHLFIGQPTGGSAHIGPLVLPGKTPCGNCVELSKSERFGMEQLIPIAPAIEELPVAITFQIAGAAVQAILQQIDTGASDLVASQIHFDYLSPIRGLPIRYTRHPKCPCQWSQYQ